MPNYKNTVVYVLKHKELDLGVYVGHTTNFTRRKYGHKTACVSPKDKAHKQPKYCYIRENGGWDEWTMEIVEHTPCESMKEAIEHEKRVYEAMKAMGVTLNNKYPGRTMNTWYQDNRERLCEKQRNRYATDPDLRERQKVWGKQSYARNRAKQLAREKERYKTDPEFMARKKAVAKAWNAKEWSCPNCCKAMKQGSKYMHLKKCHTKVQ